MVYDLPLVEEKVKPHQVTTLHLVCALGFIGTGGIIVTYNYVITMWGWAILGTGLVLLSLTMFRNKWVISKKINPAIRISELLISLAIVTYVTTQQWKFPMVMFWALSAALLFAIYWERKSGNTIFVHVDDDGLRLPVVRRRVIPWSDVELIVYRFGTITINCTDNHLFQWTVADSGVDNDVFEAYCRTKVEENIGKRRKDDW
jgi:hypothetical protein